MITMLPFDFLNRSLPKYSGMKLNMDYYERSYQGVIEPLYFSDSKQDFDLEEVEDCFKDVGSRINEILDSYEILQENIYQIDTGKSIVSTDSRGQAYGMLMKGMDIDSVFSSICLNKSGLVVANMKYRRREPEGLLEPFKPGRITVDFYGSSTEEDEKMEEMLKEEFPEELFVENDIRGILD